MKSRTWTNRLVLLCLGGLFGAALVGWFAPADSPTAWAAPRPSAVSFETAFTDAAQRISPSVVSITSTRTVTATPFGGSNPFEEFFGGQMPRFFGPQGPREFRSRGLGSGVIVDSEGHILTNNHVVADADDLRVHLGDGQSKTATVVGTDPKTDLAVIKIDAEDVQPATLAQTGEVRVGRWVLAVGSPYGLEQTVTAGIISASGRAGVGIADYEDLIQTDAAINRGNSGGPLINLKGEVVGINTAIISGSGGNQGIGFAIPVGMARMVMRSLIDKGEVVRGWLGVWIQSLTPDLAETFDYERDYGALVGDVVEDSPAEQAGLESGDIIMEFDGQRVEDASELRNRVAQTEPDRRVDVVIWRDGRQRTLEVELERLPDEGDQVAGRPAEADNLEQLGVKFVDLTSELRDRLELSDDVRGAVVAAVAPMGPAAEAGLRVGDVVTQVQGMSVKDADDVKKLLKDVDLEAGVRLRVRSGDASRFVLLKSEGE